MLCDKSQVVCETILFKTIFLIQTLHIRYFFVLKSDYRGSPQKVYQM